jgi:tRNA-splicing ligase RtcB
MACAVNYAFCNRQLIAHDVREAFGTVFGCPPASVGLELVYDVAHNIAKFETHGGQELLVHRKGATRALPPGHPQNPPPYQSTGHPALIPGTMGTGSFVVVGTSRTVDTFYSVNHGAGRLMSRTQARKRITRQDFDESMTGILYNARDFRQLADEAPGCYKDIEDVVETLAAIGLTRKVAKLRPLAVIKGQGDE